MKVEAPKKLLCCLLQENRVVFSLDECTHKALVCVFFLSLTLQGVHRSCSFFGFQDSFDLDATPTSTATTAAATTTIYIIQIQILYEY